MDKGREPTMLLLPQWRLYFLLLLIVLFITACLSSGPPPAVEQPAPDIEVIAANRTLRLGLCDFSADQSVGADFQFMDKFPQFVATQYDALMDGSPSPERAAFLKGNNPDMLLLAYWDIFIFPFDQASSMPEEVFLHDADTGNRIVYTGYPGYFIMNPASGFWRDYSLERSQEMLAMGYDGIHLDDVWADLELHGGPDFAQANEDGNIIEPYTETPSWYAKETYMADTKAFIEHIEGNIEPAVTFYNGLNETPTFDEAYYLPAADGVGLEAPLVADWVKGGYRGNEQLWRAALVAYLSVPDDKTVSWIDYGTRENVKARLYSLASYLLVARENSYYMYTPQCWYLTYLPEWDLDFGKPVSQPTSPDELYDPESGLYIREYSKSLIVVNPDDTNAKTVRLDGDYLRVIPTGGNIPKLGGDGTLTLERVSSLTMQPQEGALLLKPETALNTAPAFTAAYTVSQ